MKKVYLLGFIMAATAAHISSASAAETVAVAPAPAGCPKAFQGFHLGGNIGYGVGWAKTTFSETLGLDSSYSHTRGVRGVDGGIGVGYTQRLCNWALGIVFDANWAGTKGKHTFNTADGTISHTSKTRLRNSLQLYARLGYVMREIAMPFVGLGWENAQWKHSVTLTDNGTTDSASKSKRLNAFMWKLGVDFLATRHVVVGFDYTGSYGGKLKRSATDANGDTISATMKPQYNKFALTAKIVY